MANSCVKAVSFFGVIQRIYALFSSSNKRWKILLDNISGLTVKSLSNTRWESRVKSVQVIRYQASEIKLALSELEKSYDDPKSNSEAESLIGALENFELLFGMIIWYDILFSINTVSKKLQSKTMCITSAMKEIENAMLYFQKYREEGFVNSKLVATDLASNMDIEPIFPTKRRVLRKKQFDEKDHNEEVQSADESFRVNYFLVVVDIAIASLKNRFEQLQKFQSIFGFMFDSETLKSLEYEELKENCKKMVTTFSHNGLPDFELDALVRELLVLKIYLPDKFMRAFEILELVKSIDCLPNTAIVYQIMLSIHVTVASAEKSFSKLKLLKNYLRSSISQERRNDLAVLCIEKDMLENIDVDSIINNFDSINA